MMANLPALCLIFFLLISPTESFSQPKTLRRLYRGSDSALFLSSVELDLPSASGEVSGSHRGALSLTVEELGEALGGWGRGRIAWDCYSVGIDPYLYNTNDEAYSDELSVPDLLPTPRKSQRLGKEALKKLYQLNGGMPLEGGIVTLAQASRSRDDTTKLLVRLADGWEVETVLIPWNGLRTTVCISSQVGCRQGCTFCATGRMGKLRSLTSDEILAQLYLAVQQCRRQGLPKVTNVVFMGMGEPGDNTQQVIRAAEIMTKRELFQLSSQRVTISTVAPTPETFFELGKAPCVLAWSVHAARNDLRRKLVPTTRYSMEELREGLIFALSQRSLRTTMIEVALIQDVNDSLKEADELADFCRVITEQVPGCKLIVNLIPFNDIGQIGHYRKPSIERVSRFQKRLQEKGIYTHVRATRGDDESAACGQLATARMKANAHKDIRR